MPNNCWVPYCNSGTRKCTEKVRIFKVKECYVNTWSKIVQRIDRPLNSSCYICEKHFDEHYILKHYVHKINGEEVRIPRDSWKLSDDAVPTKYINLPSRTQAKSIDPEDCKRRRSSQPSYYTEFLPKTRTNPEDRKLKLSGEMTHVSQSDLDVTSTPPLPVEPVTPSTVFAEEVVTTDTCLTAHLEPGSTNTPEISVEPVPEGTTRPNLHRYQPLTREQQLRDRRKLYKVQYRLHLKTKRIQALRQENKRLLKRVAELEGTTSILQNLPERQQLIVDHMIRASSQGNMRGMRYSTKFMVDCILLRIRSPSVYEFMRDNGYLPLPNTSSLQKCLSTLNANSGSDSELFLQLQKKLSSIPRNKRLGGGGDENSLQQRVERALSDSILTRKVDHETLPLVNESEQSSL